MSTKYTGGFITKSPVAPTTSAASGIWTLDQQQQAQKAGTWPSPPIFIEDLFSTYLYTGNGSTQTITNNIDLSTKGGIVWCKGRSAAGYSNVVYDTINGVNTRVATNSTNGLTSAAASLTAFNTTGFSLGADAGGEVNQSAINYVSWTFREQPKFFDIVTYTGNGAGGGQVINHNLGSVPGFMIIKATSTTSDWAVCARTGGAASPASSITYATGLSLNSTGARLYSGTLGDFPTSTTFNTAGIFDNSGNYPNSNGVTYVAYLFAHDAGGFPVSGGGSTNGISCGSYTTGASGAATVTLGYEPQWILLRNTTSVDSWYVLDNMRGWSMTQANGLYPNTSAAESDAFGNGINPTATGFNDLGVVGTNATIIYIAIRKGPMKTPTVGTTAFSPIAYTGNSTSNTTVQNLTTNISGDATLIVARNNPQNPFFADKLRGNVFALYTSLTSAQENFSTARPGQSIGFNNTQTVLTGQFTAQGTYNYSGDTIVSYNFQRAPSVFDEVILSSSTTTYTHNLTVTPELILVKCTNAAGANWVVYSKSLSSPTTQYLVFNGVNAVQTHGAGAWAVSSTQFSVDPGLWANGSVGVSYLFATCAGVSKVGSYTGTGALLTLDCGFTTGARFVLIKRTDSTGDWYVWDSARGITAGNDPFSNTNTASLETTGTNYVDTDTTGFQVTAAAPAALNASGGTYIFLAIA